MLERARREPEQPWLFYSQGLDWRWVSWSDAAYRMLARRDELVAARAASRHGEMSPRLGYVDDGSPAAVTLDLAIQAAGAIPVPLPAAGADPSAAGLDFLLRERAGDASREAGDRAEAVLDLAELTPPAAWQPTPSPPDQAEEPPRGAVAVWDGEGWREMVPAELDEGVARFSRTVDAASARRGSGREIVVLPSPLSRPWGRSVCAWSLLAGAALILEPDPALRVASALWVRPTVFAGEAGALAELRRRLVERGPGRRLPLGRLRGVVALGAGVDEEEAEGWKRLGVALSVV